MKLLGTGLSGMVGSFITSYLSSAHEFENISLETGVDITDPRVVDEFVSKSDASWVLHFAAVTDVDGAEKEKEKAEKSKTWIVNVDATQYLVDACKKYKKRLLYLSTDFVFPGGDHVFTEEDTPSPVGWYATTKYEGEKRVQGLDRGLIVRISFPYGSVVGPKKDFVGRIVELLQNGTSFASPTDQFFVPTYLEDIAQAISRFVTTQATGIYHVVGSGKYSSFDASCTIAEVFGFDVSLIRKTTANAYYQGRAPRAFNLAISNDKIAGLGIKPLRFEEGLLKIKNR